MPLRRMQGFRLNIHAAPGCSPSTWHLEAQAEELRDVVACATPAVDLHTYSVRTQQVPSLVATGIIYITPSSRYRPNVQIRPCSRANPASADASHLGSYESTSVSKRKCSPSGQ